MGSIVLYILEWAFALVVLLTIYKAAFSGTTFYRFNRFYLLGATVLSALLPLVHITVPESAPLVSDISIHETEFAQELSGTFVLADAPVQTPITPIVADVPAQPEHKSSLWAVILVCLYSGYVIMLFVGWARSVIRAARFLHGKPRRRLSRTVWLVTHDDVFGPFSWMNYIVISDTESGFARRASLRHEYSHVKLLHSADLVFLLACTIVNPVCWLVLQEIKIVHEYEADHEVINHYGIRNGDYQKLLIMRTVGAEAYALASSFNLNIKKRIIMLNKNQTGKRRLMWLLILIPTLGITSVLFARTEKAVNLDDLRFSSGKVEMRYRLPEPMIYYSSSGTSVSSVSSKTVPPPPAAVTRAETFRVIGDDEVVSEELSRESLEKNVMLIRQRNVMSILINKLNEIYVKNGIIDRTVTVDELKDLAKQFIKNPDNDPKLPVIEDYEIEGYGTVKTTIKHVFSLQYDRASSAAVWGDVRYELQKAYNELRDELCIGKYGKDYDNCSDSEQSFARGMYPMKISEAQPKSYDREGNLIETEVRSAAISLQQAEKNTVNKDLRIRVYENPAWLSVSTVTYDNENGQDVFKKETGHKRIRLEGLNDYIDQAISDGMKIRYVRLEINSDVLMGVISDLKETIRHRMLLNVIQDGYWPVASTNTYDYNEILIYVQAQGILGEKLKCHHLENGYDEYVFGTTMRPLELNELEAFLDAPDFVKEDIQTVTLMVWPDAPVETRSEVEKILQKKQIRNISYRNPSPLLGKNAYSPQTEEYKWIGVEILQTDAEEYGVQYVEGDIDNADPVRKLESAVKDLFNGKRKYFAIPYSEDNLKKVKTVIGRYPNKKVNWM